MKKSVKDSVRKKVLENKMTVYFLKDSSLPYFSLYGLLDKGSCQSPISLSHFTSSLLEKGSLKKSASEISEAIEQEGSQFYASTGDDYVDFHIGGLSSSKKALSKLFFEILTQASFPEKEFLKLKKRSLTRIQIFPQNSGAFSSYVFNRLLYKSSCYEHRGKGDLKSVENIKLKQIKDYYQKTYRPENFTLFLVGDFKTDFERDFIKLFSSWKKDDLKKEDFSFKMPEKSGKYHFVHKKDLKQAYVSFRFLHKAKDTKDMIQLKVISDILVAGGFGSRLFDEIRVKRGLTYGVSGGFRSKLHQSYFSIDSFVEHSKIEEYIKASFESIKKFIEKGVSPQELKRSKTSFKGSFHRHLETPEDLASTFMDLLGIGIKDPLKYLYKDYKKIDELSVKDVSKLSKNYLKLKDMKIFIFSDKKYFKSKNKYKFYDYKDFL